MSVPETFLNNEKNILQETVDRLISNEKNTKTEVKNNILRLKKENEISKKLNIINNYTKLKKKKIKLSNPKIKIFKKQNSR